MGGVSKLARIVGELGVEITADSTGLAEEIRSKVEAAVREAATEQLTLSVDTASLARKLQDAIRAAKTAVGNLKIGVELTDDGFIPAVEAEVAKAQALAGDVKFGVELGVAGVDQAQLAEAVSKSLALAQAEVPALTVKIVLDDDGLAESVQLAVKKVQAEVSKVKIGLDINSAALVAKVKAAAEAASESSTIKPKVDPKTAEADFELFANDIKGKLSGLQSGFNGFASGFFTSVFQAAKWSTIIVGGAQAAQSVITLSGALGVLPGAIFSAVGAIAALKIGTEGVGQAIKDIGTDKFAADMAKLAPAARDTVQAVAGLKPAFEDLKLSVQQSLFDGLGQKLRDLAAADLPAVKQGLSGFADSLNQTAKGVVDFLSGASVRSDLPELFNSAQASVSNLGQALPAVLDILRNLTVVGSEAFAGVTGGAAAAAQRVADFVARSRESGALADFINAGIAAFRQLGTIIVNVITIISDLAGALGGGGILGLLAQLTGSLKDFLNSAQGSAALAGLGQAMQQIAASAGQVFLALLQNLGQVLAEHAPDIAAFAKAIGDDLVSAINALTPLLSGLLSAIGANPGLFADLAIGAVALSGALNILVPVVTGVVALIGAIGLVPAAIVAAVIAAVVLVIINFDKIKAAVSVALDAIGQFFVFLGTTISGAFSAVVTFIEGIWNGVVGFFVGVGTAIGTAVSTAVSAVGQFFADGFNAVVGFISNAITSILNFFVALPGQVAAFIAGIPEAFVVMTDQLAFAVGFGIGQVLRFFVDLPGNVISAVNSLIDMIVTWANNIGIQAILTINAWVNNLIAFFVALPGQVITAVSSLIDSIRVWAINVGVNALLFFNQGINDLIAFVTQLPGKVINSIVTLEVQIGLWALGVWQNAKSAFVNGVNTVVSFVSGLPGQVIGAIGNLTSRLFQVGVDALTGLLHGLQSIAQNILNWVGGLVANILHGLTSGFDSHSPSRETYTIGQFAGQGLANGIRDSMQLVGAAASDLAQAGLDGLNPILNPTVNTGAIATSISAAANQLSTNPTGGVNYTVQQTNVMQQGTDVNQFADAVLRGGAAALASGASLLGVSQLGTQAGVNPNFLAVSGV